MIVRSIEQELACGGIVAEVVADDDSDVIEVVSLHSVDRTDLVDRLWRVDPVCGGRVPTHLLTVELNVICVLIVFTLPAPCIASYQT